MDITITGKNIAVTDSLREYLNKKIGKVEKNFNQLLDAHAILVIEKLDQIAEVTINGDSVVFHAKVKSEDMYASIDILFDKMEKQIRRYKEKHSGHRVTPLKDMEIADSVVDSDEGEGVPIQVFEAEKKPMLHHEAILQLKANRYRFLLYKKGLESVETPEAFKKHNYAIAYRRKDGHYGIVELDNGDAKLHVFSQPDDQDPMSIAKESTRDFKINKLSIEDAAEAILHLHADYYIFQNSEDDHLNIIYYINNGGMAVKVPPVD